jgi:hypothetical protein
MQGISPEIEVYPVHHLPIIKADADQLGLVGLINTTGLRRWRGRVRSD